MAADDRDRGAQLVACVADERLDPVFVRAATARWRALRTAGLRRDLLRSVGRHARRLTATGAAGRNFRRWPVLGVRLGLNPPAAARRTTYASEVAALRRWLGAPHRLDGRARARAQARALIRLGGHVASAAKRQRRSFIAGLPPA